MDIFGSGPIYIELIGLGWCYTEVVGLWENKAFWPRQGHEVKKGDGFSFKHGLRKLKAFGLENDTKWKLVVS